jgi:ubiquitin-conjugating enzyme E2 Z
MGGKYGNTRFHPNMYKNGKMCLSILNTWRGDQWTGCQSIRTILLTILSILDNAPLLHEPGFSETHKDFIPYNEIIRYNNLEYSVCYILQDKAINLKYIKEKFEENIKHEFNKNKNSLMENINELEKNANNIFFSTSIYNLRLNTDWTYIKNEFKKINI